SFRMHNFGSNLFLVLAVFTLWRGSLSEDSLCLTELRPLLNRVINSRDQGNTCDASNVTKAKLVRLMGQQARLKNQLQRVEAKLEGQQAVLTKMAKAQDKLEGSLLAVQTKLEGQEAVLTKIENQLQAILNKMEVPQQAIKVELPALAEKTIPSGFEAIGSRYFRIVEQDADWDTAKGLCREMGGHLASFRSEEEFIDIRVKLLPWRPYWLGINDRDTEGHFISVASDRPIQFLKWLEDKPMDTSHLKNCVYLYRGEIFDDDCTTRWYFICQADN
ncbi:hypothetical protein KR054_007262, partial [Drosophila jambulina]